MLEPEVKILDIQLQIWKDKLSTLKRVRRRAQGAKVSSCIEKTKDGWYSTSSRIFFHIMRVISSPSSSTTGFFTTIFSPNRWETTEPKATNIEEEKSQGKMVASPIRILTRAQKLEATATHDRTAYC